MKSCKTVRWLLLLVMVGVLAWMGCAGSKGQGTVANESAFYAETHPDSTKHETPPGKSSDEDDVLRLLGINKSKEEAAKENVPSEPAVEEKNIETQVQQLDEKISQKNSDLADLKAELSERDRRIASLQEQLNKSDRVKEYESPISAANFKERYDAGRKLYESKKYRPAISAFEKLIQAGGEKSLLDNCQYWIGECYYGINYYNQAIVEFEKVFTYSDSDKNDDSQLKLGLCYLRIGNVDKAKSEFEKLITNYPDSEYIQRAKEYLARL
jgi:tol-pal system protein YbgF